MRALALLVSVVAVAGCGDSSGVTDGSGNLDQGSSNLDAPLGDAQVPSDGGVGNQDGDTAGLQCGPTEHCPLGTPCCVATGTGGEILTHCAAPNCPDGGAAYCDGPEDCQTTTPYCCGLVSVNVNMGTGTFQILSANADCQATCNGQIINLALPRVDARFRLCHTTADCAGDTTFPTCCRLYQDDFYLDVCANETLASYGLAIDCQ